MLLLFAAVCLCSAPASALDDAAASEPLVVVTSSNPDAPFVRRLAAELSLFGYRVQVTTRASGEVELADLLESSGGAALIAVDPGKQTVDIVVAAGTNGGPARHERERLDPRRRADTNAAVLAERFRARLTELGIAPAAAASGVSEPVPPRRIDVPSPSAAPPERRLWLAGALGGTSGGLGLVPDAQLEIRTFPVLWLSTSAFAKLSLLPAEVREVEGDTDVRVVAGGVLIDVYPLRRKLVLKAGVGALLVNAQMSGSASGEWAGAEDTVLVPAGLFEAGGAYRLSPRVSAELVGFVGLCAPRVGVRFAGRSVAQYGQPFLGASLGLAVGVF
jgi:hypothetical protein